VAPTGVESLALCENLLLSHAEDKSVRVWDLRACDPGMELLPAPAPRGKKLAVSEGLFSIGEAEGAAAPAGASLRARRTGSGAGPQPPSPGSAADSDGRERPRVRTIDLIPPQDDAAAPPPQLQEAQPAGPRGSPKSPAPAGQGRSPTRERPVLLVPSSAEDVDRPAAEDAAAAGELPAAGRLPDEGGDVAELAERIQAAARALRHSAQGAAEFVSRWNPRRLLPQHAQPGPDTRLAAGMQAS